MALCLVEVYDEKKVTIWKYAESLLSSVAIDRGVSEDVNIIQFLWSARGNKQLF